MNNLRKLGAYMPDLPSGTVTFLFTDIEGSTPLWEKMPREMQVSVAQHHDILRCAIEGNGGRVFKVIGDAFQAAFRLPGEGLSAAIAAQRALGSAAWEGTGSIRVRMGLHTGPAEIDPIPGPGGSPEYAVSHTLNRAARVMSAGHGGQILLSQEFKDLVERRLPEGVTLKDLGEHHLKGLSIPEHLYQVVAPDLPADFPPLPTSTQPPNNLPPELTSFIGREAEIAGLKERFSNPALRLLTFTGAGGTGKTRLALRLGRAILDTFPGGVWLVELAPLSDPALVVATVAQVLGVRETQGKPIQETLAGYLEKKHLLLILDNCEHLLEECSRLADFLLRRCLELVILATS
ncbi:MAG: adenylate/guanylate cyclase domain-containing protein, partial [Chloroflexi bacterium]